MWKRRVKAKLVKAKDVANLGLSKANSGLPKANSGLPKANRVEEKENVLEMGQGNPLFQS